MTNEPPLLNQNERPNRPPNPPRSGGRGWMILSIVLAVLLVLMLGGQVLAGLVIGTLYQGAPKERMKEVVVEESQSAHKLAMIEISGIIFSGRNREGRSMVGSIEEQLDLAASDPNVRGVILRVNSPGGEVMASDRIYHLIDDFQKETGKPVVAAMESVAASGGYYISVPCDWIVANPLTITGSIGVIMNTYNYRELMNKVGIKPMVFKSGKFKDMLRGSKKESEILPESKEMIQDLVEQTFQRFKEVIAEGRQTTWKEHENDGARQLVEDWEQYADGRILSGELAYKHGFVDELGHFDTSVERAKKLAGIADAKVVRYRPPWSLSDVLPILGNSSAGTVKVDLGVDFPQLRGGRLYFLAEPLFQ